MTSIQNKNMIPMITPAKIAKKQASPVNIKAPINDSLITSKVSIRNFAKVDKSLYRGGQPRLNEFEQLSKLGIKTIVNLRGDIIKGNIDKQRKIANSLGMEFIHIPIGANCKVEEEQVDKFLSIMKKESSQPAFVHCKRGSDRTGLMVAMYKSEKYNINFDQAWQEVLDFGHKPKIFPNVKKYLTSHIESDK